MSGDVQDVGQGVDLVDDEIEDVERVDQVDFGVDLVGDLGVDVGMQSGSTVQSASVESLADGLP